MEPLLEMRDVFKYFPISAGGFFRRRTRTLKAVDEIDISLEKGTSFALAGESGSGKTTVARLILLLERVTGGSIYFEGKEFGGFTRQDTVRYRTRVSAVFQDAAGSLNPRMRIRDIVAEPIAIQQTDMAKNLVDAKVEEMLQLVGFRAAVMKNYPHELSGGQKQRIAIARAMIMRPSLVVLDEPVSALDVSIRAQVLNLLADIQEKLGVTYFIIAHDLATLGHVSKRIGIMYLGRIVEVGKTEDVFLNPLHPYTKALFASMPQLEPRRMKEKASLSGEIGSALDLPKGCRFHPRCEYALPQCRQNEPDLREVCEDHYVACIRVNS